MTRSAAVAAVLLASAPVAAAPVTFHFRGQLDDPFGTLPAGTPFTGSVTYQLPQAPVQILPPRADYFLDSLTLTIAGQTISYGAGPFYLFESSAGYPTDLMLLLPGPTAAGPVPLGGWTLETVFLALQDVGGTTLVDYSLPDPTRLGSPALYDTPGATFLQLDGTDPVAGRRHNVRGDLLGPAAVPEPASGLLLAAGAGLAAVARRWATPARSCPGVGVRGGVSLRFLVAPASCRGA